MATIKKVSKAKNISAGPSKKSPIAPKVDPRGQWTGIQERTLGNMKKGGLIKKAQTGTMQPIKKVKSATSSPKLEMDWQRFKYQRDMDRMRLEKRKKEEDSIMPKASKVGKAKDGKWIQKATASIKKRGTEGKCTPITKPGCTGRAKALAKTFKKMAKSRKGK